MSRSLASYNEREQMLGIGRRLKQGLVDEGSRGCGFWAAYDSIRHFPAASLTLELRGVYIDIQKLMDKRKGGNHEHNSKSKKNVKRFRSGNVLRRVGVSIQSPKKEAAVN